MEYIVTWILTTLVLVSCPVYPPYEDKFGRTRCGINVTLFACHDRVTRHMSTSFDTLQEAEAFVKEVRSESTWNERLTDFSIKEVKKVEKNKGASYHLGLPPNIIPP